MKIPAAILITLALAVPATWFVSRQTGGPTATATSESSDRKLLYYQSAMHPWVKSDRPGRCTICGMELVPVYEGDSGFESGADIITLSESMGRLLGVKTAETKRQPLVKTLTFAGTMDDDARRHRILSAYVEGRIEKLYVNHPGTEVLEGKPLLEIYSPALLQAEREYRSASGELRNSIALRLRQMGLSPAQIDAIPLKSPDSLTSEILAPMTGTTLDANLYAGQYVMVGEKLFELADFSTMWFLFTAYEQDIAWLKVGQAAEVTTPSVPGRSFPGEITFIDPNFDPVTRSTQVRIEVPNPLVEGRRTLLHRLYGDAVVTLDAPEVLSVPRSAVIQTGPEAIVYVERAAGSFARQLVMLGRRGDALVEIVSGLNEGDKVVTNGNLLIDGQAEMNRSYTALPSMPAETTSNNPKDLATANFVKAADAAAAALAKDDLAAFNQAGPALMPAIENLAAAVEDRDDHANLMEPLETLRNASHLHGAADLQSARKAFLTFSTAATDLMGRLRSGGKFVGADIFECPMVDGAFPGAPEKGRWLQLAGTEIRNPYLGAAMLDCGVKIQH